MRIFDLHCDTIGECLKQGKSLRRNDLHLDLERCSKYESYNQVFAVWIPDELRGEEALSYFRKASDFFSDEINKNKDLISLYTDGDKTPVKAFLAAEGGSACGGTIEGLYELYSRGVRLITLTWNACNEIGGGAFSDGGLTPFGKEFVKNCEKLGIVLDVSHLNRESFWELASIYDGSFIASHSNADIVDNYYAHHRNLSIEQIKEIKSRNGLIGLNFCRDFIENKEVEGIPSLTEQIDYFLEQDCTDIIALGSDYDGCDVHSDFNGVQTLECVYNKLSLHGYSEEILNKIFFENANKFFSNLKMT